MTRGGFDGASDHRTDTRWCGALFPETLNERGVIRISPAAGAAPNVMSIEAEGAFDRRQPERLAKPARAAARLSGR